jgi:phosphoribosylanthranilate isomerase
VKLCGITDLRGIDAAVAAEADGVGLNFVPGTKRCLTADEGRLLADAVRSRRTDGDHPAIIGIFADQPAEEVAAIVAAVGLERVQLSGRSRSLTRRATPPRS